MYVVCDLKFRTKEEITKYVRSMLNRYEMGQSLKERDYEFIYDLLQRHNRADEKIGCGIKAFRKMRSDYGKHAFEIVRTDGSTTDFSFVKCINPRNEFYDFRMACRDAIKEDVMKFKKKYFEENADEFGIVICPLTNEGVSLKNSHVDHKPPNTFDTILRKWIKDMKINPKSIKIKGYGDNESSKYFKDSHIKEDFRKYHNKLVELRITSSYGNLSTSKKENRFF